MGKRTTWRTFGAAVVTAAIIVMLVTICIPQLWIVAAVIWAILGTIIFLAFELSLIADLFDKRPRDVGDQMENRDDAR